MYRAIVKSKVRGTFDALSQGDSEFLLKQLADPFSYEFVGDHALSGRRTSRAAMEQWFARLDEIFEDLSFETRHVEVGGPPWNTTVLTEVVVRGRIGGEPYENLFFQRIGLKMGRIHEIRTLEDTQHLVEMLDKAAAAGVLAASAPPITGEARSTGIVQPSTDEDALGEGSLPRAGAAIPRSRHHEA